MTDQDLQDVFAELNAIYDEVNPKPYSLADELQDVKRSIEEGIRKQNSDDKDEDSKP